LEYEDTEHKKLINADLESIFYKDGTVRVGGREYNALLKSPCYERGSAERKLGCLSCHQMHGSEPDDQLGSEMGGNAACTQCHQQLASQVSEHSHHKPDSAGSLCYNCHMPHTSYALLKAIRSHRITSPNLEQSLNAQRPSACNLCHLDKSLAWTAKSLDSWYGQPQPTMDENAELPAGAVLLLSGDAATRAIAAWHMGQPKLRAFQATAWLKPLLVRAQQDPYRAVAFIADRSLRSLPGGTAEPPEDSRLTAQSVARLVANRDNRPISIAE
jgi:predicted CXXCH cytochrome family protein